MPFASFPRPAAEGMRLCRSVRFRTAAMLLAAALLLADGEAERAADQHIDLLHARELDEVGRRGAAHLRHVLADRLTTLGRDDEHLFAGAEVGRDLTFVECYADVHNRPSTVERAPESASGSFASSILPASTASASFGSIGSLARTGSS